MTHDLAGDLSGELELTGRIMPASNATFVGTIGGQAVVYKPTAGERPLWDFPDGRLAQREVAAHAVSQVLGWNIVPHTWLGEGPHGPGMLQMWCEPDPDQNPVDLVMSGAVGEGWRHVFDGLDAQDRRVSLVHEDSPELRRMAVFDIVVNNADRKGGHVLAMTSGHRYGIDHGLTFHIDHKLRTVLWGWTAEPLTDEEVAGVERVRSGLAVDLGDLLAELLTADEVSALAARCDHLLSHPHFPAPSGEMPAVPWPPF
ncbi:MAG: SCO1664 family protein [Aeromicrobium sp.]|uniref:SCO1664 family protein n=1 Tax=Aeromicrobium sp. TaxID=1871063 RepID=UPI003C600F18